MAYERNLENSKLLVEENLKLRELLDEAVSLICTYKGGIYFNEKEEATFNKLKEAIEQNGNIHNRLTYTVGG